MEALKLLLLVLLPLLVIGLLPFIDNFAHIGGLVFGFLLSGIFVPYWKEKKAWEEVKEWSPDPDKADKYKVLHKVKIAMIVVFIPLVIILFLLFILLFYLYQESATALAYFNCVPFTSTFCIDNLPETRNRDIFVV